MLTRAEDTVRREGGVVCSSRHTGQFLRLAVNFEGEPSDLAAALIDTPGVALHSLGHTSEVIKGRRHSPPPWTNCTTSEPSAAPTASAMCAWPPRAGLT